MTEVRILSGANKPREKKKKSMVQRFGDQFKDVMILILIAAAVISFVIACMERDSKELFEPILILLIVILNAIMGVLTGESVPSEKDADTLTKKAGPAWKVSWDSGSRRLCCYFCGRYR